MADTIWRSRNPSLGSSLEPDLKLYSVFHHNFRCHIGSAILDIAAPIAKKE